MPEEITEGSIVGNPEERESEEKGALFVTEAGPLPEVIEQKEAGREQAEGKYNEILSKVAPVVLATKHGDDDVALDTKSIGETLDEESKIQKLLDLASAKGVVHAVKVARSLGDYYALDRMHDELANKLYNGLLERGLIQKD